MKWVVRVLLTIILTGTAWTAPLFGNADYAALGFKSQKRGNRVAPTLWEKQTFGLLGKSRVTLKSRFASVLGKTSYYRFVVEEEAYPDAAAAGLRLDSLFVRTDVAAYQPMLTPMVGALQVLVGLPDSTGRKSKADSLGEALKRAGFSEAG